ncbi:hypothetical protein BDR06DRAFT_957240 [Suillus hirtellus]|nr:hypothetical protein BDR06DRAFT_957240 [Suillus hirtellus]
MLDRQAPQASVVLASMSGHDNKNQDGTADLDDVKSQYAGTQSGGTAFWMARFIPLLRILCAHYDCASCYV